MNYIKHLNNTLALMDQVQTFKPYHISLYLVLFRMWNTNRFENPISISRKETMHLAKIGSSGTYLKALKDLHHHGFIRYDPSFDPTKGSLIHLFTFDTATCSLPVSKMIPSINNTNSKQTHTIEKDEKSISNPKNENMKSDPQNTSSILHQTPLPEPAEGQCQTSKNLTYTHLTSQHRTSKHLTSQLQSSNIEHPYIADRTSNHPPLTHIQIYFQEKGHPESEAQRFFNYYESNGWLIGGKSPMKDWKAAARNWILNIKKFEKKTNEVHKKQFQRSVIEQIPEQGRRAGRDATSSHRTSLRRTSNNRTSLHPTSPPPSSSNYEEPL